MLKLRIEADSPDELEKKINEIKNLEFFKILSNKFNETDN
jgi:hypothetical protein